MLPSVAHMIPQRQCTVVAGASYQTIRQYRTPRVILTAVLPNHVIKSAKLCSSVRSKAKRSPALCWERRHFLCCVRLEIAYFYIRTLQHLYDIQNTISFFVHQCALPAAFSCSVPFFKSCGKFQTSFTCIWQCSLCPSELSTRLWPPHLSPFAKFAHKYFGLCSYIIVVAVRR